MEGNSYLDELTGKPKEKESIWQLLMGIPQGAAQQLRPGRGELRRADPPRRHARPARAGLGRHAAGRRRTPDWLSDTVDDARAERIQVNINRAADVNPINLLAIALLSTPKHAMGEARPARADRAVARRCWPSVPYSDRVTVTPHTPAADHRPRRGDRRARRAPRIRSATCSASTATTRCCSATSATTCCTCSRRRRGSRAAS